MSQINQNSTGDQNQNIGNVTDSSAVFRDVYGNVNLGKCPTTGSPEWKREKIILFIEVHPVDTMSLRLDEEVREIENALKRTKQREKFKLELLRPVRLRDIKDAFLEHTPQIVHFSGYGIKTEGFAIADDAGEIKLVTTDDLKNLFRNFSTIECVILNVGFSEQQSNAIVQHMHYVIDLSLVIDHKTAIEFTKEFYTRRVSGMSIKDSFNFARDSITSFQNIPVIKERTKPENLIKYRTQATKIIISLYKRDDAQISQIYDDTLEEWRLELQLLPEEASAINDQICQLLKAFELDIKAKIKKYKSHINTVKINEFSDEMHQALSEFQDSIRLGEEAVDEVGNKVGDKIISDTYLEVAYDLFDQKQLSEAKVFCEEAAKFDKENPLVYKCLASIWFEKQNYTKALVELNKSKRLFAQKKMLKEANEIDLFINRIPVSSRIIHLIEKLFIK